MSSNPQEKIPGGTSPDPLVEFGFQIPEDLAQEFTVLDGLTLGTDEERLAVERHRQVLFEPVRSAIKGAEINLFDSSYFRVPVNAGMLEVLTLPVSTQVEGQATDMLRIIFSIQRIDEFSQPETTVADFFVDYSRKKVYAFGGDIEGIAQPGATLEDVTWNVYAHSPPSLEYVASTGLDVVFNTLYEESTAFSMNNGLTADGRIDFLKYMAMVSVNNREELRTLTQQRQ